MTPLYRMHSRMLAVSAFVCGNFANFHCPVREFLMQSLATHELHVQ